MAASAVFFSALLPADVFDIVLVVAAIMMLRMAQKGISTDVGVRLSVFVEKGW